MTKSLWKCPNCGRRFTKSNQWHSCLTQTIDHHFQDKDRTLKQLYDLLMDRLHEFGPLRVDAVKSSINLISKYHFGAIIVKKDHLSIGFLSNEVIEDGRIVKMEWLGPKKFGYSVLLRSPGDIDSRLIGWLKKAYTLQSE